MSNPINHARKQKIAIQPRHLVGNLPVSEVCWNLCSEKERLAPR